MKVPISWLEDYVPINVPLDDLGHRLTMSGTEVDSIEQTGSYEGVVVGLTVDYETNQLAGLMIREREVARLSSAEEIELDRILGLRDPVYHRLILGSHAAIDSAVVRSLALAATNGQDSARRTCVTALGRFVERREVSLAQISGWLEDVDAGALMHDPAFSRGVRVV